MLDNPPSLRCSGCTAVVPMLTNGCIQRIEINKEYHRKCNMNEDTYYIKKINAVDLGIIIIGGETTFYFVASANPKFVLEEKDPVNPSSLAFVQEQIGFVSCSMGSFDMVRVDDSAKRCGLSTVLSTVCMKDPV